mgnify:CR=1 FL=1
MLKRGVSFKSTASSIPFTPKTRSKLNAAPLGLAAVGLFSMVLGLDALIITTGNNLQIPWIAGAALMLFISSILCFKKDDVYEGTFFGALGGWAAATAFYFAIQSWSAAATIAAFPVPIDQHLASAFGFMSILLGVLGLSGIFVSSGYSSLSCTLSMAMGTKSLSIFSAFAASWIPGSLFIMSVVISIYLVFAHLAFQVTGFEGFPIGNNWIPKKLFISLITGENTEKNK